MSTATENVTAGGASAAVPSVRSSTSVTWTLAGFFWQFWQSILRGSVEGLS